MQPPAFDPFHSPVIYNTILKKEAKIYATIGNSEKYLFIVLLLLIWNYVSKGMIHTTAYPLQRLTHELILVRQ